jgi:hypothetical protein
MRARVFCFLLMSSLLFSCGERSRPFPTEALYVDGINGADNNPGTREKPIKTISELNSRLQKKGSSVFFASDQVYEGTLNLKGISGTGGKRLLITSMGSKRAVINGGNSEAIRVENCNDLIISNLNIIGNGRKGGNTTNGLSVIRSRSLIIERIKAEGFQKSGVDLFDCKGISVKKVVAVNNGFSGINVMGSDRKHSGKIFIYDCKAENNPGDPTMSDNHSGNGILIGVSDSVTIDRCSASDNGWDMPRIGNGPVGIWAWESDHIIIQYCISYRNKTSKGGKDGGGYDLDGGVTNSLIQYCLSWKNEGAGYGLFQYSGASNWSGNVVRYCISINDAARTEGAGSFFVWNGSNQENQLTDCKIYNNIVFNSAAPIISYEKASAHKNFTFRNNIFIGIGETVSGTHAGSTFIRNFWWNSNGNKKQVK